ncbi:MAG: terminase family protein [Hyphomicrobiales bacterium]
MSQTEAKIDLGLHPKQKVAFQSDATEILYGGAAGGGKSHLMRTMAITFCAAIPGLQVYLFRRIHADLVKNHMEGVGGFRALLASWEQAGFVKIIDDEVRFWNGSKIYLCHCLHEKDRFKYQGAEIHLLLIDELTHFSEKIYRFLRSRCRKGALKIPKQYEGLFPRILCGANPGNLGHLFVKQTFVDISPELEIKRMPKSEGGMLRQFIPAKLSDNPSLEDDYEDKLSGLGSVELVKAMKDGNWDVIEGAYFSEWDKDKHVIKPFTVPEHWTRFLSGDWGSAKPFSFHWSAIASEDFILPSGKIIPKGAMIVFREWYGIKTNADGTYKANVGVKLTAEKVGAGLKERCPVDERLDYGVLDPACFAQDGGPSIYERMYLNGGIHFRPADNKRVARNGAQGGWDMLRNRLVGEDERPMLYFFDTCTHIIRTLPALQHDEVRPEDVDTTQEDHAPDEIRYACMSRPWTTSNPEKKDVTQARKPTLGEIMKKNMQPNGRKRI